MIAFHYLGWKAVLHMLPASYLFWALSNTSGAELDVLSPIVSMVACYIGFLGATVVVQKEDIGNKISTWKYFVLAGATSSFVNGLALSWLQFADTPLSALVRVLSDECPPMIPMQWGFEDKIGERVIDVSVKRRKYIGYHNRYVFRH
ncbi:MAG: hypothetical protein EBX06_07985 [Rhodobacteraceae bacterium]|nr:hypothetical protein [Paracoccaceae bacterium]